MIITTTPTIQDRKVIEYKGIVFGEVIAGVNVIKDFTAGLTNFFGGRSITYEEELMNARTQALAEMEERAARLGANAVIENCVVMNDAVIGEGAKLKNVILDKDVVVRPGAQLMGTPTNPVIVKRGEIV